MTQLVKAAPEGPDGLHEIKNDGYRIHARIDSGAVKLLTPTGLDWTHKYPAIAAAVASLRPPLLATVTVGIVAIRIVGGLAAVALHF